MNGRQSKDHMQQYGRMKEKDAFREDYDNSKRLQDSKSGIKMRLER